jgi:hypothetical protein
MKAAGFIYRIQGRSFTMTDLLLIFPPQWSPFQPALSLPSLAAWLRRAGYDVTCIDLNILFFHWLFSDECADLLLAEVEKKDWELLVKRAYQTIFTNVADFRKDIQRLKELHNHSSEVEPIDYVQRHYIADHSVATYLGSISQVVENFRISPYEFSLKGGNLNAPVLEHRVQDPPPLLKIYFAKAIAEEILPHQPQAVGISCIGQDQLYCTLLLGSMLKTRCDAPILVGGTILPRIFERGVLKQRWFGSFFDIVVRNEGEKPCEQMLANLHADRPITEAVPGIVYLSEGRVVSTQPACSLNAAELPHPDFDDLPLDHYFSAEVTLPILSSRGCYWGKCEFCHHGMVYGDKYGAYEAQQIFDTVQFLADRYQVKHFAFNDEAVPPKLVRAMGHMFPSNEQSGWNFTGLIKFEKYFQRSDFDNLARIGFRSFYVGLESASERVLALMRKNNKQQTMIQNLTDATAAGIWMHCFLFFGFPGETDADAQETYDFVMNQADIIGSFGSATFVLEHNAPIYRHLEEFDLKIKPSNKDDVDVYYAHENGSGITPERALYWMHKLNNDTLAIPKYGAIGWVPREHLLCLLSILPPARLIELGLAIKRFDGLPRRARLADIVSMSQMPGQGAPRILVTRLNRRALAMKENAAALLDLFYQNEFDLETIGNYYPPLLDRLSFGWQLQPTDVTMPASATLRMH